MDNIKEFLSTISHEIRTPLTSIKGFSKTMLDCYDNLSDEQKRKFLKIIAEQSERLIILIENALTAADSQEEYNSFVFKKADINKILNKALELVKINYKNVSFKTDFTPGLYSALDLDRLQQVFVNLLDNAAKYGAGEVEIKTGTANNFNYAAIKNFGKPIPAPDKEKIFEKFYRCQSYLTSKAQGSGLGLYIVKMLTEKMNGKISVNSNEKQTEFRLQFPVFAVEEFTKGAKVV